MFKKTIVLSTVLVITCLVTVDSSSESVINLNQPGVLEKLQQENPEHYQKIQGIIDCINKQPESRVSYWLQTKYDAHDVLYGPVLLTSLPPKKHISFTLDNTHYEALLTLTDFGPQII